MGEKPKLPETVPEPYADTKSLITVNDIAAEHQKRACGFPPNARLLNPKAYSGVFEKRSVRRGRFFHLHLGPMVVSDSLSDQACRLGIAVPKKLLKTAVHRNLVKRIARETFRHMSHRLIPRDYVLRLTVKLNAKTIRKVSLAADAYSLFTQCRLPCMTPSEGSHSQ